MSGTRARRPIDRYAGKIQFKIQEAIDIRDDEIERLDTLLATYKTQILDAHGEIKQLEKQIQAKYTKIDGDTRRKSARMQSLLAQRVADQHRRVTELHEQQQNEMKAAQQDFEFTLKRFYKFSQDQFDEQQESINREIEELRQELDESKRMIEENDVPEMDDSADLLYAEINNSVIEHLQQMVIHKNEERKRGLFTSREQLRDVVGVLEEMDGEHFAAVENMRETMEEEQTRYETEIAAMDSDKEQRLRVLRQLLVSAEARYKGFKTKLRAIKIEQDKRLASSTNQLFTMRERIQSECPRNENVNTGQHQKIGLKKKKVQRSRTVLAEREQALEKARNDNFELHRSVARAKHMLKFRHSENL